MNLIKSSNLRICLCLAATLLFTACSVSYKFNGASIDYNKTKTIQINDFPIRSAYVWGPMAPLFNNALKDQFASHTKLTQVRRNGDLKIEGEITQYQQRNKSVSAEGYSAQTELSMTVNVRFTNNANHAEDFERQFTATSSYETTLSLNAVQDELVTQMCKEICDQIFNATVANW
jgi:hypothetical protein